MAHLSPNDLQGQLSTFLLDITLTFKLIYPMTAREVIKLLEADGWYLDYIGKSSHHYFRHPSKPGKVPVPVHAGKDLKKGTLNSILKQAGLK